MSQHIGMWSLEKKGEAQLDLGGIRKELQWPHRVTQRTLLLSIAEGTFLSARALHLPHQWLGLHFRQQGHISIQHQQHQGIAATFTPNSHWVLLENPKPGISMCSIQWKWKCSALPLYKTRPPTSSKPSELQESQWTFCSDQVSARSVHCTAMIAPIIWNIPLENLVLTSQIQQTKSFLIIWRNLLNSFCKSSVTQWKHFRNSVLREAGGYWGGVSSALVKVQTFSCQH